MLKSEIGNLALSHYTMVYVPFGQLCQELGSYEAVEELLEYREYELEKAYDLPIDVLEQIAYGRKKDLTDAPMYRTVPHLPLKKKMKKQVKRAASIAMS